MWFLTGNVPENFLNMQFLDQSIGSFVKVNDREIIVR